MHWRSTLVARVCQLIFRCGRAQSLEGNLKQVGNKCSIVLLVIFQYPRLDRDKDSQNDCCLVLRGTDTWYFRLTGSLGSAACIQIILKSKHSFDRARDPGSQDGSLHSRRSCEQTGVNTLEWYRTRDSREMILKLNSQWEREDDSASAQVTPGSNATEGLFRVYQYM
nr:hypothetical protein CFP56_63067 [Quercus suber]